jgi:methanogenic corrinoid protein MtbC1
VEPDPSAFVGRLLAALDDYDETEAERILDDVLERFGLDEAVALVLMPFLVEVGDRWESGAVSVTQEHFASHLVRSRLTADVADVMPTEDGPTVVVACAPGERHDIAPLAFSVLMRREGWQVRYLGADTPMADLAFARKRIEPDLVVVAASRRTAILDAAPEMRRIAAQYPVAIAGAGATRALRRSSGPPGSTVT